MNKWIGCGRITKDIEIRYTQSGKAVAGFSLAISEGYGEKKRTEYVDCVAWEKLAENLAQYQGKGSLVLVTGRLQKRSYEAQDGSKRYITEVVAQDIEFMGSKPQGAAQEPSGANSFGSEVIYDETIPF